MVGISGNLQTKVKSAFGGALGGLVMLGSLQTKVKSASIEPVS